MFILQNISITDAKKHKLIENLTYSLGNSDKVGIIGEEGNGKSTLLKYIMNPSLVEDYALVSGRIDTDIQRIGYFEQQLSNQWEHAVLFEFLLQDTPGEEIPWERYNELKQYEALCAALHIKHELLREDRTIATLSGGEKVKLQLLKLMARKPQLLLLDEPTNDLDVETLVWLEAFLKQQTIPVLFISHDETLLQHCANVILHIEQRNKKTKCVHTIFRGTYEDYAASRRRNHEKEVQLAHKERIEYKKKKSKLNDQMNAVRDAQNDLVRSPFYAAAMKTKMRNLKVQQKHMEEANQMHVDSVEEAIDVYFDIPPLPATKTILDVHMDTVCVGNKCLLRAVDITLYGQEKKAIVGANGCGKSILMKRIYDQLSPRMDIKLGYMPQTYGDLFQQGQTPITFLTTEETGTEIMRARELLGCMKFTREEMEQSVTALSEGQKAKLYLLRFVKQGCNVLLLDEPTRNLSPLSAPVLRRMLQEFPGAILAVSHDRTFLNVFTSIYEIKDGQLYERPVPSDGDEVN